MKLIPKARPVRIRVVTGGMEHSSLKSLTEKFVISDLIEPLKDGRLATWLKTINEGLAKEVERFEDKSLSTIESRKRFCELFGVAWNADMYCEDFDLLCVDYEDEENPDYEEWLERFRKCRSFNAENDGLCQEIDLYMAEMMIIEGEDFFNAIEILAPLVVRGNYKAKEMLDEIRPATLDFDVDGVEFTMILVEGNISDPVANQRNYYVGETTVTDELWTAVMGSGYSSTEPVTNVSWVECNQFIDKLNQLTGKKFSLPTSEQWYFAAKGGKKSRGFKYSGSDHIAAVGWVRGMIHPVAELSPNELGFYDMSGNVWEWCLDEATKWDYISKSHKIVKASRVVRGGGCNSCLEVNSSVGFREEKAKSYDIGFRLCLNI